METLAGTNLSQRMAYANDELCEDTTRLVPEEIESDDSLCALWYSGDPLLITSSLHPLKVVIAAPLEHVVTKGTGAIKETGHNIVTSCGVDGNRHRNNPIRVGSTINVRTPDEAQDGSNREHYRDWYGIHK